MKKTAKKYDSVDSKGNYYNSKSPRKRTKKVKKDASNKLETNSGAKIPNLDTGSAAKNPNLKTNSAARKTFIGAKGASTESNDRKIKNFLKMKRKK